MEYHAEGKWILNNQVLQLSMVDNKNHPEYEAKVIIGYDSTKTQYVVHWLDVFGGEYSKTQGFGAIESDRIQVIFNFADEPFRDTIIINDKEDTGEFLIEYKESEEDWKEFAKYRMKKIK